MRKDGRGISRRIVRNGVAAMILLCVSSCLGFAVDDPGYCLVPWPYGAMAWVGGGNDRAVRHSEQMAEAVREVFTMWELPPPEEMLGWTDPASVEPSWKTGRMPSVPQVIKRDPSTGDIWRLTELEWDGITIHPLLFITFPSVQLREEALGNTRTLGKFIAGNRAPKGASMWFLTLIGGACCMATAIPDGVGIVHHELAHWMTYSLAERDDYAYGDLPPWIDEGIAEYTEASCDETAYDKEIAAEWASTHRLEIELGLVARYTIGLSVVTYLVETQGAAGFLATLPAWARAPRAMIGTIESGWRAWLGLEG